MRVVGIVAEYNPLHNGHIYHLEQARRITGASYVVAAMSGNFVQRGEPACTDKFTRAYWALQAGVDLVLEIPSVFANASAERFCEGAVRLLAATGMVTDLAFGCEQDNLNTLYRLAEILADEPPAFKKALAYHLKQGKSFPRARYDALAELGLEPKLLAELAKPNNILAIEYLRCIKKFAPHINPVPIRRIGNDYHDENLTGELSSATAIRGAYLAGNPEVIEALPLYVSGAIQFDSQFPVTANDVGAMMLYKLRTMTADDARLLPDVSEGFEQKLLRAARESWTAETFFEAIKSKRYTLARCKRIGMSALLDISVDLQTEMQDAAHHYLRVLGLRKSARALISAIVSLARAPLIMRNADMEKCTDVARESLRVDALSTDILAYALGREMHRDSQAAVLL
ncbi:MAG: nucleotidyltransferase family protein [Clostridiales bacterium]|nr:nucleotidyltransferase family protein [Clostridiales bacterium]